MVEVTIILKNILNDKSEKLLTEILKVCELQMLSIQENIKKQREILEHMDNHAQFKQIVLNIDDISKKFII